MVYRRRILACRTDFPLCYCLLFIELRSENSIDTFTMRHPEGDIDESQIPGTVLLVDVEHTAEALHSQNKDSIILIPTPSNDINDPLNWSTWRKRQHLICLIA
jgi:hypothetical protein